jgi:hypothetical protein
MEFAFRPDVFDADIAVLDVAVLAKAASERRNDVGESARGRPVGEADHWQRWLLLPPRSRPRRCRAAEKRDELAPLDAEHGPLLRSTETIAPRGVANSLLHCGASGACFRSVRSQVLTHKPDGKTAISGLSPVRVVQFIPSFNRALLAEARQPR